MENALSYVSQYLVEPEILSTLPAGDPLLAEVPEWWSRVLRAEGDERIAETLRAWEEHRAFLPAVFDFLSAHLRRVNLLTDKTSVRLLYELQKDGRTMYYSGGNPTSKSMSVTVSEVWGKLPARFRAFYESLHNGWYYLASNSLGPSPTEDFFILDDLEWGVLDDIGDPGCDLKDLLAVYTNGMGAYVALSIERRGAWGDVLWWKDGPPRLNVDAWAVMDTWTEMGLNS